MVTVGRYDNDLCIRSVRDEYEAIIVLNDDGISLINRSDHKDDDDIRVKLSMDTISIKLSKVHLKSDNFVVGINDLLFFHEKDSDYVYYINYKITNNYINIIGYRMFEYYFTNHRNYGNHLLIKRALIKNESDIDRISDNGGICINVELKDVK